MKTISSSTAATIKSLAISSVSSSALLLTNTDTTEKNKKVTVWTDTYAALKQ